MSLYSFEKVSSDTGKLVGCSLFEAKI